MDMRKTRLEYSVYESSQPMMKSFETGTVEDIPGETPSLSKGDQDSNANAAGIGALPCGFDESNQHVETGMKRESCYRIERKPSRPNMETGQTSTASSASSPGATAGVGAAMVAVAVLL